MKTININGKEYTENEFNNQVDSEDIFFEGFHNCEDAEDLKQFIFQGLRDEFPRQQPEPPTLRPMSELPEVGVRFNILVLHTIYEAKVWDVGLLVRENEISNGFRVFKLKDKEFKSGSSVYKIVGWLPLPLPNANEMKLP